MRAIDAVLLAAEHEVVARGAPRGLLVDLDVRHTVLGEQSLFFGDHQRRRIHQRDVAKDCLGHFRSGGLRERAAREIQSRRGQQRRRSGTGLEQRAAAHLAVRQSLSGGLGHRVCRPFDRVAV